MTAEHYLIGFLGSAALLLLGALLSSKNKVTHDNCANLRDHRDAERKKESANFPYDRRVLTEEAHDKICPARLALINHRLDEICKKIDKLIEAQ